MRFSEEGEIDTSFGVNGRAEIPVTGTDNELTSISVMQDGRIIAAGHYETAFTFFDVLLIRFHPDGTLDSTLALMVLWFNRSQAELKIVSGWNLQTMEKL